MYYVFAYRAFYALCLIYVIFMKLPRAIELKYLLL